MNVSVALCESEAKAGLRFTGYVKEQSLQGIVQWFDFWLSQEGSSSSRNHL